MLFFAIGLITSQTIQKFSFTCKITAATPDCNHNAQRHERHSISGGCFVSVKKR